MTRKMFVGGFILTAVFLVGCVQRSVPSSASAAKARPEATPEIVIRGAQGDAFIIPAEGEKREAEPGVQVNSGDTIQTGPGATVDVNLQDHGVIRIDSGSEVVFTEVSAAGATQKTILTVNEGSIVGNVGGLSAGSEYEVRTRTGTLHPKAPYIIDSEGEATTL